MLAHASKSRRSTDLLLFTQLRRPAGEIPITLFDVTLRVRFPLLPFSLLPPLHTFSGVVPCLQQPLFLLLFQAFFVKLSFCVSRCTYSTQPSYSPLHQERRRAGTTAPPPERCSVGTNTTHSGSYLHLLVSFFLASTFQVAFVLLDRTVERSITSQPHILQCFLLSGQPMQRNTRDQSTYRPLPVRQLISALPQTQKPLQVDLLLRQLYRITHVQR